MDTKPTQSDAAIDTALAALRAASPPEGMNARIANRLRQHAIAQAASTVPNTPRTSAQAAAWWRGAAAGAATALLAMGLLLVAMHLRQSRSPQSQDSSFAASSGAIANHIILGTSVHSQTVAQTPNPPCVREPWHTLSLSAAATDAPSRKLKLRADGYAEAAAPSHPAPVLPLTAEERQLVRLAHTADPQVLSTINPETQAKLLAQQGEEFEQFFASSPTPPTNNKN